MRGEAPEGKYGVFARSDVTRVVMSRLFVQDEAEPIVRVCKAGHHVNRLPACMVPSLASSTRSTTGQRPCLVKGPDRRDGVALHVRHRSALQMIHRQLLHGAQRCTCTCAPPRRANQTEKQENHLRGRVE